MVYQFTGHCEAFKAYKIKQDTMLKERYDVQTVKELWLFNRHERHVVYSIYLLIT